jgi:hypothetical protein
MHTQCANGAFSYWTSKPMRVGTVFFITFKFVFDPSIYAHTVCNGVLLDFKTGFEIFKYIWAIAKVKTAVKYSNTISLLLKLKLA